MLKPDLPVYVKKVVFGTEKIDQETRKVVRLQCLIAPFTAELASLLPADLKRHLFRMNDGEPLDNLADVRFKISLPSQRLILKLAPDQAEGSRILEVVKVEPRWTFRRDKETPTIEAKFWFNLTYPDAQLLRYLAEQQNEQVIASFYDLQEELKPEPETKSQRKKREQPALTEEPATVQ